MAHALRLMRGPPAAVAAAWQRPGRQPIARRSEHEGSEWFQGSANLNVMITAARRAGRGLVRDFGEVEKLQVSVKGAGDFVSRADTRAEEVVRAAS
jgi:hypothetical protein